MKLLIAAVTLFLTSTAPAFAQVGLPENAQASPSAILSSPVQLSPADGSFFSDVYPRTTTLRWSAVANAVRYGVEVDCFLCCLQDHWCTEVGGVTRVEVVDGTSYTFDFVGSQPGRWRVWAIGDSGKAGPRTGWWEFSYGPNSADGRPARLQASRNLTLSQRGILALDYEPANGVASILSSSPRGEGVEYAIRFSESPAHLYLLSSAERGKGALTGFPLSSTDAFALKFTLLSPTPSASAFVKIGAVINQKTADSSYSPVLVGGAHAESAVSAIATSDATTRNVGFCIHIASGEADWPPSGGVVRLLVEPAPGAQPIEPKIFDQSMQEGYRDSVVGNKLTLSRQDLLALDYKPDDQLSASILSVTPREEGVEYTVGFHGKSAVYLLSSGAHGSGALAGLPLSSRDSLALRFTLLSSTAVPRLMLSVGAIINQRRRDLAYSPALLSVVGDSTISLTGSDATVTTLVGFCVGVVQYGGSDAWPESGETIQILVEPVSGAIPLGSRAKTASH